MEPLDVQNWLAWKHEFQIFLASKDHLEDAQKVLFFLDCLGFDGRLIAFKLFPDLVNYDKPFLSVTFAQVWWQLNEHCLAIKSNQTGPAKDLLKDRENLQLICDQEKDEVEHPTLLKLIPMLSMCELEFVSRKIPRLERVVRNFAQLFGVRIEPCCLKNHQIGFDESIYIINGLIVSSLTLNNLPESDAINVLPFFRKLKHFCMENMQILDDISEFPTELVDLTLINCKIEEELLGDWFYDIETTLKRLHMDNFESFIDYLNPPTNEIRYLGLRAFENVQALTLKSKFWCIGILENYNLEFLTIISGGEGTFSFRAPLLRSLHIDVPKDSDLRFLDEEWPLLQFVTLGNWRTFGRIEESALASVEEVEILSEIDPKHKAEVDSKPVKVLANYWYTEPSPEPSLIFDMLNYDCLLQIISHLPPNDWMNFGRLHENAEMVVATYKYPKISVSCQEFIKSGMFAEDRDHFNRISKLVQNLEIYQYSDQFTDWKNLISEFENISTLRLGKVSEDIFDVLPCGLEKLVLGQAILDDTSLKAYMRKINPTLRSLKISDFEEEDYSNKNFLSELLNLEEISIKIPILPQLVKILLERNSHSLKRVKLAFLFQNDVDWTTHEMNLKLISTLSHLTELAIVQSQTYTTTSMADEFINPLADLLRSVGPKLKKLSLTGWSKRTQELLNLGCLKDLSELKIDHCWEFVEVHSVLRQLTGLRILEFQECDFGLKVDQESGFIQLIKSLPNLEELRLPNLTSTFQLEKELRRYLKQVDRTLHINSVKF